MSRSRTAELGDPAWARLAAGAHLSRRARRGDRRAFEQIYRRFHQELYRYCLAILRDREDAADALQATMAAALRALPGERREVALRPWLYRVAHNESISLLRSRTPAAPGELAEDAEPAEASAEAQHTGRERLRRLVADLRALPDRQCAAIVMRELSDLPYGEIGAALSCSEAAARQTVFEARTALRELEEGREMDCERIREALSERDGRRLRGRRMRAHLSSCDACQSFQLAIAQRRQELRALCPPLAPLTASGIFAGIVGGSGGAGVAGAGVLGGGLAGSAAVKGASLAAAVALAAGAADLGGVIHLPRPGGDTHAGDAGTDAAGGAASPAFPTSAPWDGSAGAAGALPAAPPAGGRAAARGDDAPSAVAGATPKEAPEADGGRPQPVEAPPARGDVGSEGSATLPSDQGTSSAIVPEQAAVGGGHGAPPGAAVLDGSQSASGSATANGESSAGARAGGGAADGGPSAAASRPQGPRPEAAASGKERAAEAQAANPSGGSPARDTGGEDDAAASSSG